MKSLKQLAEDAINVQDACNLTGVAYSFADAMRDLRANLNLTQTVVSTRMINEHPIAVLWSSKIASLTGSEGAVEFAKAYDWAKQESGK